MIRKNALFGNWRRLVLLLMLTACSQAQTATPTPTQPQTTLMPTSTTTVRPISTATPTSTQEPISEALNVILLIGDGMGETQRMAARWVRYGQNGSLVMDSLDHHGWSRTASADSDVTDSAAGATAISTGNKTYNGRVAVDVQDTPLTTLLEIAQAQGKSVGLITTVFMTDATPAAFAAHVPDRGMRHEIADQILGSQVDVILGGGENDFLPTSETGCYPQPGTRQDGRNLIAEAQADGYTYVCDLAGFRSLDPQTTTRLIGLFGDDEMLRPYTPSLLEMTETAIEILSRNPQGFLLMVEGAQIDWACHGNSLEFVVADVLGFDQTVALALQFAETSDSTLVVVAADHETGGMSLSLTPFGHPREQGPFSMPNGTQFYVLWETDYHTGVQVPISAQGPMADLLAGTYENTHIFEVIHSAMIAE